jgi:hypothetical protein
MHFAPVERREQLEIAQPAVEISFHREDELSARAARGQDADELPAISEIRFKLFFLNDCLWVFLAFPRLLYLILHRLDLLLSIEV